MDFQIAARIETWTPEPDEAADEEARLSAHGLTKR